VTSKRAPRRPTASVLLAVLGSVWWLAAAAAGQEQGPRVLTVELAHAVGPVTAEHVVDAVGRAEREGYEALVVVIDTPGGLDTSMRRMTQRFLAADVPVVAYVAPRGARAASAGAIITLAAHVAAMAPGTVIGAATPVGLEGGDVERKIVNDAAALAESLARLRGRDVEFYVDAVREGRSAAADEAVEIGAVELLASSLEDLLDEIDGTEVELRGGREHTLATADAAVDEHPMGLFRNILRVLADPNLAFLFLSIGTLGIIYELASPGIGVGGVVGGVLVVLAMFGLSVLSVNVVGILLLLLAVALFVAELFAPGVGVFAGLGAFALALSGIFLFDDVPGVAVSVWVILPTALVLGAAVVLAGRIALRARSSPSTTTGSGVLVGEVVEISRAEAGRAQALVGGAWWTVRADRPLAVGDRVRVVDVDGLELVGEPVGGQATTKGAQP
jgi:membrane-bound serine protease (ClpP class)